MILIETYVFLEVNRRALKQRSHQFVWIPGHGVGSANIIVPPTIIRSEGNILTPAVSSEFVKKKKRLEEDSEGESA